MRETVCFLFLFLYCRDRSQERSAFLRSLFVQQKKSRGCLTSHEPPKMSRKSAHFLPLFIAIFEKIKMNAQISKEISSFYAFGGIK